MFYGYSPEMLYQPKVTSCPISSWTEFRAQVWFRFRFRQRFRRAIVCNCLLNLQNTMYVEYKKVKSRVLTALQPTSIVSGTHFTLMTLLIPLPRCLHVEKFVDSKIHCSLESSFESVPYVMDYIYLFFTEIFVGETVTIVALGLLWPPLLLTYSAMTFQDSNFPCRFRFVANRTGFANCGHNSPQKKGLQIALVSPIQKCSKLLNVIQIQFKTVSRSMINIKVIF